MTVLAGLAIVGALLMVVLRRFGAALVFVAAVVASIWSENMSDWEVTLFWVLFLVGLAVTFFAPATVTRSGRTRSTRLGLAGVGAVVLLLTILMVTAWPWQWVWNWEWAWAENIDQGWALAGLGLVLACLAVFLLVRAIVAVGAFVALCAVVALVVGLSMVSFGGPGGSDDVVATGTSTTPASPLETPTATVTETKTVNEAPSAKEIAEAVTDDMGKKGFKRDEYTADPDWDKNVYDVASPFAGQTLKTNEDVSNFLNGTSQGSKMARKLALDSLETSCDRQRALDGSGYVPIQFKIDVQYGGNPYKVGDKIITPDGLRQAQKGDVIWLFTTCDGKIDWGASVRADCGNVEFDKVIPVRPHTPKAPPVTCVKDCSPPPGGGGCDKPNDCKPPCVEKPGNGKIDCQPKKPGQDPYPQGNAPTGGGKNEDPGKGVKNPKPTFAPTYSAPTKAPEPTKTPRPDPTPTPESDAPSPSAPETTCYPAPGKSSC